MRRCDFKIAFFESFSMEAIKHLKWIRQESNTTVGQSREGWIVHDALPERSSSSVALGWQNGERAKMFGIFQIFQTNTHRYLIYLDSFSCLLFKMCMQNGFVLIHIYLWLISCDKSILTLVDMHLLKGDNNKMTSAFQVICFLSSGSPSQISLTFNILLSS